MTVVPEPAAGLLVIAVDRLPAWILPAHGATWVAMPALDRLAARGVVFDRLITTTVDPLATLRQLAGLETCDAAAATPGANAEPTPLAAAVARRGFRAAVVTDDIRVAAAPFFGVGAAAAHALVACVPPGPAIVQRRTADETAIARLVDAAIAAVGGGRRCVLCQVSSLGELWDAPEEYRGRYVAPEDPPPPAGAAVPSLAVSRDTDPDLVVGYRQIFAGQLTLLDERIGRLVEAVDAAGGEWTILVVGLRGLPLGLHGWFGTGGTPAPFSELIHVPAILVDGAGRMAGQRYAGLVTPADLGATLPELMGGEPAAGREILPERPWRGRSIAGLFESWTLPPRRRVVVAGEGAAAIVSPHWHAVIAEGHVSIYAKPDDYFELVDVADRRADLAERIGAGSPSRVGTVLGNGGPAMLWMDESEASR